MKGKIKGAGALAGFIFFAVLSLCLSSCKDEKDSLTLDYHYDYFPLDTGRYIIYDVDSVHYRFAPPDDYRRDTARYQLMEMITDTFYDNLNQLNYQLDLFRRTNSASQWTFFKRWSVKSNITNAQKKEDDANFMKLIFPPKEGDTWNGNQFLPTTTAYEMYRNWNYQYSSVHQPMSVNGLNFDSTLTVDQVDHETLIDKTYRKEMYAKGVGLIYQDWEHLEKQNVTKDWQTGPENGFRIRMRIREYYP